MCEQQQVTCLSLYSIVTVKLKFCVNCILEELFLLLPVAVVILTPHLSAGSHQTLPHVYCLAAPGPSS